MKPFGPRNFLFLQGPHGPFFAMLARALEARGHNTRRIGFNSGDRLFRRSFGAFERYTGSSSDWDSWLAEHLRAREITDLVLYGATRPIHLAALELARQHDITAHVFEEGYLRPWWVTYERGGTNLSSRLMDIDLGTIGEALRGIPATSQEAPARWGDTRQHIFWGAVYHAAVIAGSAVRAPFPTHREPGVPAELLIALRYLAFLPLTAIARRRAGTALRRASAPYHVVLLQLLHDANYRASSPYPGTGAFLDDVIASFARGAPSQERLVFKAHPLEDGRQPLSRLVRDTADRYGVRDRVHFLAGAPLAPLLDSAKSAITVNSTAVHQALWRDLPVRVLGKAPHTKAAFTSTQTLTEFFRCPESVDRPAYAAFRQYLLATCQVPGGFYSARARRRLLATIVDGVLAPLDPFDTLHVTSCDDAEAQQVPAMVRTAS